MGWAVDAYQLRKWYEGLPARAIAARAKVAAGMVNTVELLDRVAAAADLSAAIKQLQAAMATEAAAGKVAAAVAQEWADFDSSTVLARLKEQAAEAAGNNSAAVGEVPAAKARVASGVAAASKHAKASSATIMDPAAAAEARERLFVQRGELGRCATTLRALVRACPASQTKASIWAAAPAEVGIGAQCAFGATKDGSGACTYAD